MREMADRQVRDTLCDFDIRLKELSRSMDKLWQLLSAPQGVGSGCD